MTEESATRPSLVEGAPVCGAYVCGRLVRHDPWVSVYLARSAGGGDFNFEARVLHVEPRSDAAAASAFAREASRLQELHHAGIARIVAAAVEGGAPVCSTLQRDPANCGACGRRCCNPTDRCAGGACTSTRCFGTQMPCTSPTPTDAGCIETVCVDTSSDDANCGACNRACPDGTFCVGSRCIGE